MVGFNEATSERNAIATTIFICFLINSCLVPVLLSGNFSIDYPASLVDMAFSIGGRSGDFDSNWYRDTSAQLTSAIVVLSLQPILFFLAEVVFLNLSRSWKRNIAYARHDNNHLDNIKFLELNAGPDYPFQLKVASVNAVLFMTLFLGAAFPIFYPIALLAIMVQYFVERFTLARFYRLPPKFSLDLTLLNLNILSYAPLCCLVLSFWLFGNHQMFSNENIETFLKVNAPTVASHHYAGDTIAKIFGAGSEGETTLNKAEWITFAALALVVVYHMIKALPAWLRLINSKHLDFQQNRIPNYYDALREQDLQELVEEEQTFAVDFKTQNVSEFNLNLAESALAQRQREASVKKLQFQQFITGEPYYQVYKNFDYWLKFNN